jgi:hypothetical protein
MGAAQRAVAGCRTVVAGRAEEIEEPVHVGRQKGERPLSTEQVVHREVKRCVRGFGAFLVVSAFVVLAASESANADTIDVARDYSNYTMGTSSSGHSGGGEWGVLNITGSLSVPPMGSGVAISGNTFQSFCLERNETLVPGTYNYSLSNAAHNGGVGGATNGADPISAATAWLYDLWWKGGLTNVNGFSYNYTAGSGRVSSAGELQDAIWLLENELTNSQISTTSAGYAWAQAALSAVGNSTSIGNVRVLTLTDSTGNHQDILVMVPLPSAALLGIGLMSAVGAFGIIRRRKNQSSVLA